MSDIEKAILWLHNGRCRVLVMTFDGKVPALNQLFEGT